MDAARARSLAEFELETEDFRIALKTQGQVMQVSAAPAAVMPAAAAAAPAVPAVDDTPRGTRVEAPLVGIFYSSPSPEEPPFVEVGQKVSKGDTIFIIEAMKTMNEIAAPCDGTVSRIYAQSGDMVEYKQLICMIE
ncbi:MAG: acetyl-CoA carboxylase, biotin carboxyl carrier protein [Clostridia bacterium]|nr:acetyl-CoA carboxylase, biotin carboxyl carrier protein [Clostridia bacterium]